MSAADRDFKLEVLRLTLEPGSAVMINNPLEHAERNLQWCLAPIDKPSAQLAKSPKQKPGQAA